MILFFARNACKLLFHKKVAGRGSLNISLSLILIGSIYACNVVPGHAYSPYVGVNIPPQEGITHDYNKPFYIYLLSDVVFE